MQLTTETNTETERRLAALVQQLLDMPAPLDWEQVYAVGEEIMQLAEDQLL